MGTLGQMGIWNKWALRTCGCWSKWTFGEMGTLGQMGALGPMSIAASKHHGQMGTWKKCAPEKMSTRAMGNWGKWALCGKWIFGTNGRWEHVGTGTIAHLGEWALWGKWALGVNGHLQDK